MIKDILLFRRMVAPVVLQILFWSAVGGNIYGTYVLWQMENWAWPFPITLGVLLTRVIFEILMLSFNNHDRLKSIDEQLKAKSQ